MGSSTISRAGCVFQTRWAAPGPLPDRSLVGGPHPNTPGTRPGEHDLVEPLI